MRNFARLILSFLPSFFAADEEGPGICATILTFVSFVLVLVTMPLSLCVTVKVSQSPALKFMRTTPLL